MAMGDGDQAVEARARFQTLAERHRHSETQSLCDQPLLMDLAFLVRSYADIHSRLPHLHPLCQ